MAGELETIGAFAGTRQAEADQWQNKLHESSLGLQGAQTREAGALADEHTADAALKNLSLQQEQTYMKLQQDRLQKMSASGQPQGGQQPGVVPNEAVSFAEGQAEDLMRAGKWKEAIAVEDKLSLMRYRNQQIARSLAGQDKDQLQAGINEAKLTGQLLNGVTDEASWRMANLAYQSMTGKPSPFAGRPYDPKFVDQIRKAALTVNEQATLAIRAKDEQSKEADRGSAIRKRAFDMDFGNIQRKAEITAEARQKHLAPKGVSPADSKAASEFLTARVPGVDTKTDTALKDSGNRLAEHARSLMMKNPALSRSEALQRAFDAGKSNYVQKGKLGAPQTLPKDRGGLVKDQPYKLPDGRVGIYNGSGFEIDDSGERHGDD